MKNIFKKLHIGGSNHEPSSTNSNPNRSNETNNTTNITGAHRSNETSNTSINNTSITSTTTGSTPTPPSIVSSISDHHHNQDYYTSEEEYQVQLALALSVSGRDSPDIQQIHAPILRDSPADLLSRQYWDYGVLDYEEKVVDGFYVVYGLATDSTKHNKMPSLAELQTSNDNSGFEVVVVNQKVDPVLEELMQIARCIADTTTAEVGLLVHRIAELVTEHMGGPVRDANTILQKWTESSTKLRTSLHTSVLPVGSLKVGLSRHRALLFKVLADYVGITCRLVKGSHYTGVEDDAINIIKLEDESEFLVDLMGAPGTLIPMDIFSTKDTSLKPYIPNLSKIPNLPIKNDSKDVSSSSSAQYKTSSERVAGNGLPVGGKSGLDKTDVPSVSRANGDAEAGSSVYKKKGSNNNQLDHIPSLAIGSSLYKGGRGLNAVGDGSRMNVNVVPYAQTGNDEAKNLFADLNPFQIKGPGKMSMQNKPNENKVNDFQKVTNNVASGRPPVPLKWKNTYAYNDTSREKRYGGAFSKENREANSYEAPFASTSSSANANYTDNTKVHVDMGSTPTGYAEKDSSTESCVPNQLLETYNVPRTSYTEQDQWRSDDLDTAKEQSEMVYNQSENRLAKYDLNLNNPEIPSKAIDFSRTKVEIDDVWECEIPWEDLVLGDRIGLGSYGEVYHADWKGVEVAVKKFLDQDFSGAALAEFKREVRIMRGLRHPNVVLFMGAVTRPPNLSIITEYLPRGSLYRLIHRPHSQIDEKRRIKMALDVAKGMHCLHASRPTIVHRDLKSPNLLVDKNWNVKVGDFGLSRLKHNTFLSSKSTAGTPEWMAPEVLRNENSNEKCDVYSFGVILWELATLRLPWSGMNPMQVVGAVGFQNRRLDIPANLDPLVARIIWECWQTDPNLRPSFAQLAVTLKPLQRLAMPSHDGQENSLLQQEIPVNFMP
ncbi:hypothetical protein DCAR_0101956 [Daucus carota subsp. sativus]|uniref:non-specific serine/threonine protein kinase n=1 Tax=Daucus carota subsp. sativus TaxID=79200 RepID=A0A162B2R6_DAUCS|nr:PREDICTED: serine/threonine-protein kinase EDR1 isoform X2 [Daucus carota subsp. sativus]WOG82788.1 hypothetical protein DCAR_0101956 [Daucus carota subsp. sativus]